MSRTRSAKPVARYAVIAPISKNPRKPGHIFYREQQERNKRGLRWCWNDSTNNSAKVGDLFAFYFHGKKVVFHKILSIKSPEHRLPSWSNENRNFLELSCPLFEYDWDNWCNSTGPQCNRKTYRTNLKNWPHLQLGIDEVETRIAKIRAERQAELEIKKRQISEEESLVILRTTATEITDSLRALDFKISTILL